MSNWSSSIDVLELWIDIHDLSFDLGTKKRDKPLKAIGDWLESRHCECLCPRKFELVSHDPTLPRHVPLVAYCSTCGNVRWWTQRQATQALREVVALAGVQPQEYALHCPRIGGATHLSAVRPSVTTGREVVLGRS